MYLYVETDFVHFIGNLISVRSFCLNRIKIADCVKCLKAFIFLSIKTDVMFCTSDVLACSQYSGKN